jgi:hypothetical protein
MIIIFISDLKYIFSLVNVEKDLSDIIGILNVQNNLIKKYILGKSVFEQRKSISNPLLC